MPLLKQCENFGINLKQITRKCFDTQFDSSSDSQLSKELTKNEKEELFSNVYSTVANYLNSIDEIEMDKIRVKVFPCSEKALVHSIFLRFPKNPASDISQQSLDLTFESRKILISKDSKKLDNLLNYNLIFLRSEPVPAIKSQLEVHNIEYYILPERKLEKLLKALREESKIAFAVFEGQKVMLVNQARSEIVHIFVNNEIEKEFFLHVVPLVSEEIGRCSFHKNIGARIRSNSNNSVNQNFVGFTNCSESTCFPSKSFTVNPSLSVGQYIEDILQCTCQTKCIHAVTSHSQTFITQKNQITFKIYKSESKEPRVGADCGSCKVDSKDSEPLCSEAWKFSLSGFLSDVFDGIWLECGHLIDLIEFEVGGYSLIVSKSALKVYALRDNSSEKVKTELENRRKDLKAKQVAFLKEAVHRFYSSLSTRITKFPTELLPVEKQFNCRQELVNLCKVLVTEKRSLYKFVHETALQTESTDYLQIASLQRILFEQESVWNKAFEEFLKNLRTKSVKKKDIKSVSVDLLGIGEESQSFDLSSETEFPEIGEESEGNEVADNIEKAVFSPTYKEDDENQYNAELVDLCNQIIPEQESHNFASKYRHPSLRRKLSLNNMKQNVLKAKVMEKVSEEGLEEKLVDKSGLIFSEGESSGQGKETLLFKQPFLRLFWPNERNDYPDFTIPRAKDLLDIFETIPKEPTRQQKKFSLKSMLKLNTISLSDLQPLVIPKYAILKLEKEYPLTIRQC